MIQLLRAPGDVHRPGLLADETFEAELAGVLQDLLRATREILAEAHHAARLKSLSQARLRSRNAKLPMVAPFQERRVEDVVDDLRVGAALERVLQRLEARAPVGPQHHDLAVEPRAVEAELAEPRAR